MRGFLMPTCLYCFVFQTNDSLPTHINKKLIHKNLLKETHTDRELKKQKNHGITRIQ